MPTLPTNITNAVACLPKSGKPKSLGLSHSACACFMPACLKITKLETSDEASWEAIQANKHNH